MTNLEIVKEKLYEDNASLVVLFKDGTCKKYYHRRVEDIVSILKEDKDSLNGATIADKVIGKVAGSILTVAGVSEIYAEAFKHYKSSTKSCQYFLGINCILNLEFFLSLIPIDV